MGEPAPDTGNCNPPGPGLPSLDHDWEPPRAVSVRPGLTCVFREEQASPSPPRAASTARTAAGGPACRRADLVWPRSPALRGLGDTARPSPQRRVSEVRPDGQISVWLNSCHASFITFPSSSTLVTGPTELYRQHKPMARGKLIQYTMSGHQGGQQWGRPKEPLRASGTEIKARQVEGLQDHPRELQRTLQLPFEEGTKRQMGYTSRTIWQYFMHLTK